MAIDHALYLVRRQAKGVEISAPYLILIFLGVAIAISHAMTEMSRAVKDFRDSF